MSRKKTENPNAVSTGKIIAIFAVVLVGVALGSVVVLKKSDRDAAKKFDRPGALGHEVSVAPDTNNMVWIPAGKFWMGSDDGQVDEKPVHEVTLKGFWMD